MTKLAGNLITATEFYDMVMQPENRGRHFELDRGEVIEMPPPGKFHGFVCGNAVGVLRDYTIRTGRGYVCSNDAGFVVEQSPDTVRGPDVTLYIDDDTSENMTRGYAITPPVLAVEVLSPSDRVGATLRRLDQMLSRGVQLVWLVDFEHREVSAHRNGERAKLLGEHDTLTAEPFLPGLHVAVAELFRMPGVAAGDRQ